MSLLVPVICFVSCHGGPADHFSVFSERFKEEGYEVRVCASGPAVTKFQERGISSIATFDAEDPSAEELLRIARICSSASVVITDVGHPFDVRIQNVLARVAPGVKRWAYLDNPEAFVPGDEKTGYSAVAERVMRATKFVLTANPRRAKGVLYRARNQEMDLRGISRVGLGYYPYEQADKLAEMRTEKQAEVRAQFFTKYGLKDTGQKVWVYFGGNNTEYFEQAFPAFVTFVAESTRRAQSFSENTIIVLQQHPGAKGELQDPNKNIDRREAERVAPQIVVSEESSHTMQIVADGALYYQTSMGPLFVLAGIPTIQVGHERYEDVLVEGKLIPSVTDSDAFVRAIAAIRPSLPLKEQRKAIFEKLGIRNEWFDTLKQAVVNTKVD